VTISSLAITPGPEPLTEGLVCVGESYIPRETITRHQQSLGCLAICAPLHKGPSCVGHRISRSWTDVTDQVRRAIPLESGQRPPKSPTRHPCSVSIGTTSCDLTLAFGHAPLLYSRTIAHHPRRSSLILAYPAIFLSIYASYIGASSRIRNEYLHSRPLIYFLIPCPPVSSYLLRPHAQFFLSSFLRFTVFFQGEAPRRHRTLSSSTSEPNVYTSWHL
jgi:hypothetical protein